MDYTTGLVRVGDFFDAFAQLWQMIFIAAIGLFLLRYLLLAGAVGALIVICVQAAKGSRKNRVTLGAACGLCATGYAALSLLVFKSF